MGQNIDLGTFIISMHNEMNSLNNVPLVPLQKIIKFLDEKSCENLLLASAGSQLEMNLECITIPKTMVCPYCVGRAGFENVSNYGKAAKADWVEGRKSKKEYQKFVRLHHEFNFFRQFEFEAVGDKNYQRKYGYDGSYKIESKRANFEEYGKISFMGDNKCPEAWWGHNFVNVMKAIKNDKSSVKQYYKKRMENIYIGGEFDGVPIESVVELFTKEDLLVHIREFHYSDLVHEARKKNPYRWYNKVAREGELILVPEDFYFISEYGEPRSMLDQHELENLVMDIATARYIRNHFTEEISGRHIMESKQYMMTEIREVYKMIKTVLDETRFPKPASLSCDIRYYKMVDLINIMFELVI